MNRRDGRSIDSKFTGLITTMVPDIRQRAGPVDLFVFIDASAACPEPTKFRFAESERMHG